MKISYEDHDTITVLTLSGGLTADQQDAYATARWLTEMDHRGFLARYFEPSLTDEERKQCNLEGWILGVC